MKKVDGKGAATLNASQMPGFKAASTLVADPINIDNQGS